MEETYTAKAQIGDGQWMRVTGELAEQATYEQINQFITQNLKILNPDLDEAAQQGVKLKITFEVLAEMQASLFSEMALFRSRFFINSVNRVVERHNLETLHFGASSKLVAKLNAQGRAQLTEAHREEQRILQGEPKTGRPPKSGPEKAREWEDTRAELIRRYREAIEILRAKGKPLTNANIAKHAYPKRKENTSARSALSVDKKKYRIDLDALRKE
jgi:hypothetical protein